LRRAKNITNKPRINEDPKDAMLREFQDEIMRLKAALAVSQRSVPYRGHCVAHRLQVTGVLCAICSQVIGGL
jgi:hypothetical protein